MPTRRRKPANLIYDVDEKPGLGTLILLGFEHICVLSIAFVFPVLVVTASARSMGSILKSGAPPMICSLGAQRHERPARTGVAAVNSTVFEMPGP